jgi:hypothetical protein
LTLYFLVNRQDIIKNLVLLLPSIILAFFFFTSLVVIWSSLYFLNKHRRHLSKAIPILTINLLTLGIILSINDFIVLPDFFLNLKDRQAAVELVLTNLSLDNKIDGPYVEIELPPQYSHLSQGFDINGGIAINLDESGKAEMIIFTNYIGRRKYSAFIYTTETVNEIWGGELRGLADISDPYVWILETKKLTNHWFWVDVVRSPI